MKRKMERLKKPIHTKYTNRAKYHTDMLKNRKNLERRHKRYEKQIKIKDDKST
jgi:hypothetical protein